MSKFILAILLFISIPSFASDWSTGDTYSESVYLAFLAVDWAQTRNIVRSNERCSVGKPNQVAHCYHYPELNPILGKSPSMARVNAAVILTGLAHVYIASILPEKYRAPFQYISIGIEGGAVVHNFSIGIGAKF